MKHYENVGKALSAAQQAYGDGEKKLKDRGQSIVLSANKLIELRAKNGKNAVPEVDANI